MDAIALFCVASIITQKSARGAQAVGSFITGTIAAAASNRLTIATLWQQSEA
jgi:hypothetical protein